MTAPHEDTAVLAADQRTRLEQLLEKRILIMDGAMGTMIQAYGLDEDGYRGERLRGHTRELFGNNDLLVLSRPDVVAEIHDEYLAVGSDAKVGEGRSGHAEVDGEIRTRHGGLGVVFDADIVFEQAPDACVPRPFQSGSESQRLFFRYRRANAFAHPTEGADDQHPSGIAHPRIPSSFITTFNRSRFGGVISVSGSRISDPIRPNSATAALTGMGLVSQKRTSNSGKSRR